jgi:uncharacterized protein with ParB-like and HNH nuclease domain
MPTNYTPERMTIGNLLSTTNPPIRVPDWQRNYSWTTSEVEVFWKDILNFDKRYPDHNIDGEEYFLGSVVLVDNNAWNLLLDGQQRLATSAILLSVIRDYLARYNMNAAVRTSNRFLTDYDDASQTSIYKITLNRYDRDFFKREILELREGDYTAPFPTIDSHEQIRKARNYFEMRFEEKYNELNNPQVFHSWALRIQRVLTQHISVVAIISQDEDNAALVFETLNDRGIGLSTPDLLRNLVMRRAANDKEEEIAGLWGEILASETDIKLKTFLRHYWISHQGDVKTQSLYREIRDYVLNNDVDSLSFSRRLRDSSIVYRDILGAQDDDQEVARLLGNLNELGATIMYPMALSAFESIYDKGELQRLLRALVITYVRHSIIGRLENSLLENIIYDLAKSLRINADANAAVQTLRDFAPGDDAFTNAFQRAVVPDRSAARYILREIEASKRTTEELEVALPPKVHVEHIYPQTPRQGQKWDEHSFILNRIGNLTLLSRRLNTAVKNAPFAEKKLFYQQSELIITKELDLNFDDWSPDNINQRQIALSRMAKSIWAFPE